MVCPVCGKPFHDDPKDWFPLYLFHPKFYFKGEIVHKTCVLQYNLFWYQFCQKGCNEFRRCGYTEVCGRMK